MPLLQMPSKVAARSLDTAEELELFAFRLTERAEVRAVGVYFVVLQDPGEARARLRVSGVTGTHFSSWLRLGDYASSSWAGILRFSFPSPLILGPAGASVYHTITLEMDDYTMEGEDEFIGVGFDWPNPTVNKNVVVASGFSTAAISLGNNLAGKPYYVELYLARY